MKASRLLALGGLWLVSALFSFGCSDDRGVELLTSPVVFEEQSGEPDFHGAPAGYYDMVDPSSAAQLRSSLHAIIDDHTRFPYTSTGTDTWDILETADQDPNDPNRVLDVYRNESYPKYGAGNTDYNREHTWPKSYGFPNDGSDNYPFTDCHHLFLANDSYNSSRSNKPFRSGDASWSEQVTVPNGGVGGGSGVYPGFSNWTTGSFDTGGWEVWVDRRGDVARALLYLDVRYEGGTHGVTGVAEPDLVLTDDDALIAASNTGANLQVAYMGMLSVLLAWHMQDPVDDKERARNDAVYAFQGNRNPFIDHPEWVDCIFSGACGGGGDTTPPAAPIGLVATGGSGVIVLDWADSPESDLAGYDVYRSTQAGGPFTLVTGVGIVESQYTDGDVTAVATFYYQVTASDLAGNESSPSAIASATANGFGGGGAVAWINEFHYDNSGTDTGEFVEIAGTAGLDLGGWSVVGYNGNGGVVYATISLSGTVDDEGSGFGAVSFAFAGMQNGSPDGLALVDGAGVVVEFLSYEGTIVAADGPALGSTSVDVGVVELTDTPVGWSLQRTGSGSTAAAFAWSGPAAGSAGSVNAGQTIGGGTPPDTTPPAIPTGLLAVAGDGTVDLDWNDNVESDLAGYDVLRATSEAGPYSTINGATLSTSSYVDLSVTNGVTYYYAVQAKDTVGNTSAPTSSVTATPQDATPPAAPTGVVAVAGDGVVDLDWNDNVESDFAGYNLLRATAPGGPYTQVNGALLLVSAFGDGGRTNGTTYYYVVEAVDEVGNVSPRSSEVSATPQAPPAVNAWINEFHYDDKGADANEFVEIAGTAGTDLTGWTIVGYNGENGSVYGTVPLGGSIPSQESGYGTVAVFFTGLQNGSPDGIALVDGVGNVLEFISYEGTFTATSGPAAGMTSTDVGVFENGNGSDRDSLQRKGVGLTGSDFTWSAASRASRGSVNANQDFAAPRGSVTARSAALGVDAKG